jgi:WD repeat-containing protein 26
MINFMSVATLFSGITATTIQFSYQTNSGVLSDAVNAFWFSSLLFGIFSVVTSLVGLTWKEAIL